MYLTPGTSQQVGTGIGGSRSFTLTGGTPYVFKFLACKFDSTDSVTINSVEMHLDVNKGV
jgi:hypothetical protein